MVRFGCAASRCSKSRIVGLKSAYCSKRLITFTSTFSSLEKCFQLGISLISLSRNSAICSIRSGFIVKTSDNKDPFKNKKCSCDQKEKSYITWLKFKPYTIQRHPVTLEWFSIQVLVNSEIFKLSLNLSPTRLMAQIACYELERDLRSVMLKEIFHDSLKISKFTRISIENHSSMTVWQKDFFSHTNPYNFWRPLQSLLLRYAVEN